MPSNIHTSIHIWRREQKYEHNDHQSSAPHLTFQQGTDPIQSSPIDYHIANDNSNDAV